MRIRNWKVAAALACGVTAACAGKSALAPTGSGAEGAIAMTGPLVPQPQKRSHEEYPFVGTMKVNRYILDNGLRLLVEENHTSPTFAYQTWYRVGSKNEVKGLTGLAHLFEHMMFKGTKNHPEGDFDRILESNGAEGENAFTDRDYTAFVQELPKGKLDLIASLESDRMVNLIVDDQSFKTEREVVQNERRYRTENSPSGVMDQELFGLAFVNSPYRWPVIGYPEDLERMTAADARNFYQTWYAPNHATVVVTGDVDSEETYKTVEKYYGGLNGHAAPAPERPQDATQDAPRRKQLALNIQGEKLLMGYHEPGAASEDSPALDLFETVLTGGNSSRLHRALVESGIASEVSSESEEDQDPTLYLISAGLQKGKKAAQAESVVLNELARLRDEPVSDAELERAKNRSEFEFYDSLSSNMHVAEFLGNFESVAGDFRAGLAQHERVRVLTAADLQSVAKKYFQPSNRTVITGVMK